MTKVQNIENLQIVFYILKDLKEKRLSVAKISKEAGLNANNVHKWGKRDSIISFEDGLKIYAWAVKTDYSPKDWESLYSDERPKFGSLSDIESTLREIADAVKLINSNGIAKASEPSQEGDAIQLNPTLQTDVFVGKKVVGKGKKKNEKKTGT